MNREPSLSARYSVAGNVWHLSTNSADLIATVRKALPGSHTDSNARPLLRLDICVADHDDDGPWERPVCRGRDHLVFSCLSDQSALVFDYPGQRVVGEVSRAVARDVGYWRNIVLPFTLGVMAPLLATVPLHAACIIHNGSGVLIGARSGAGKSTLAATLARRGVTFVSDDWVYLTAKPRLCAHSMPVPLKLLPDAVRFFPELQSFPAQAAENGEISIPVDPAVTFGARREFWCQPSVVILFDRAPGSLRVRQASAAELAEWFSESLDCVPPCLNVEREQQLALIRRLQECQCYVVVSDGSPESIADDILHVAEGAISPTPTADAAHSSGIVHLDLLRRGSATPHTECVAVGDRSIQLATNHPDLVRQFARGIADEDLWTVTVIADSTEWPQNVPNAWTRSAVGFFSFGANGVVVCNYELREAAAFVVPSAIDDGSFATGLERVLALAPAAAMAGAGR